MRTLLGGLRGILGHPSSLGSGVPQLGRGNRQIAQQMSTTTRRSARLSAAAAAATAASTNGISSPQASAPVKPKTAGRKRKAATLSNGEDGDAAPAAAPSTPTKRRQRATAAADPATPKPRPAAVRRLADPSRTNAALLSPETSRVVTARGASASPSKQPAAASAPATTVTTENLLQEACAHLIAVDPRMRPLIEAHPCRLFSPEGLAERVDPFGT